MHTIQATGIDLQVSAEVVGILDMFRSSTTGWTGVSLYLIRATEVSAHEGFGTWRFRPISSIEVSAYFATLQNNRESILLPLCFGVCIQNTSSKSALRRTY